MADPSSPIQFDDVPLDEARRLSRTPRMEPMLYDTLRKKIESLSTEAVRITIPDGTSQNTMKNRILRVAGELGIPVTIRRVPGGLVFWRLTEEDLQQAKEVAQRLQPAQRKGRARPRGRQRA